MKYLVKTVKVNGEEKIDARRDSFNKTKSIYCVKSEKGQIFTVDKNWLKAHKEELVNVGISGDSLYLKVYNKKSVKNVSQKEIKKNINVHGKQKSKEDEDIEGYFWVVIFDDEKSAGIGDFIRTEYTLDESELKKIALEEYIYDDRAHMDFYDCSYTDYKKLRRLSGEKLYYLLESKDSQEKLEKLNLDIDLVCSFDGGEIVSWLSEDEEEEYDDYMEDGEEEYDDYMED